MLLPPQLVDLLLMAHRVQPGADSLRIGLGTAGKGEKDNQATHANLLCNRPSVARARPQRNGISHIDRTAC